MLETFSLVVLFVMPSGCIMVRIASVMLVIVIFMQFMCLSLMQLYNGMNCEARSIRVVLFVAPLIITLLVQLLLGSSYSKVC